MSSKLSRSATHTQGKVFLNKAMKPKISAPDNLCAIAYTLRTTAEPCRTSQYICQPEEALTVKIALCEHPRDEK